jgi:hypothetical protein
MEYLLFHPSRSGYLGASDCLDRFRSMRAKYRLETIELVHRLISGRHTAVGDLADFQGASDEHTEIRT